MKNKKIPKEDVNSIIRIVILGLLGVILSILFIWSYIKYHNIYITIISGLLSLVYMVFSLIIINNKDLVFENTKKAAILFPIIYTIIIFAFLVFINYKITLDNPIVILDCFLYAVYMMPSYLAVMAALILILAAMSYAG